MGYIVAQIGYTGAMIYRLNTLLLLVALLLCSSCSSTNTRPQPISAESYLQMASQTMGTESYQLQLLAADRYITSNKTSLAQPILNSLAEVALPPELFCTHQLLQAQIYVNKNQSTSALRVLNALKNSQSLVI